MDSRPLRLACLISGGGRTMANIADHIERGRLTASIELVIASRAGIAGLARASERNLPAQSVLRSAFATDDEMHDRISALLRAHAIDLVCLCGYLRWVRVDPDYHDRIINIHPALLPDFGGAGFHGERVHAAVLASGRTVSGCTVHFVDERYDHGPIILQRTCPVLPGDTAESLAARVFAEECIAYPQAIQLFVEQRVQRRKDEVRILPAAAAQTHPDDA